MLTYLDNQKFFARVGQIYIKKATTFENFRQSPALGNNYTIKQFGSTTVGSVRSNIFNTSEYRGEGVITPIGGYDPCGPNGATNIYNAQGDYGLFGKTTNKGTNGCDKYNETTSFNSKQTIKTSTNTITQNFNSYYKSQTTSTIMVGTIVSNKLTTTISQIDKVPIQSFKQTKTTGRSVKVSIDNFQNGLRYNTILDLDINEVVWYLTAQPPPDSTAVISKMMKSILGPTKVTVNYNLIQSSIAYKGLNVTLTNSDDDQFELTNIATNMDETVVFSSRESTTNTTYKFLQSPTSNLSSFPLKTTTFDYFISTKINTVKVTYNKKSNIKAGFGTSLNNFFYGFFNQHTTTIFNLENDRWHSSYSLFKQVSRVRNFSAWPPYNGDTVQQGNFNYVSDGIDRVGQSRFFRSSSSTFEYSDVSYYRPVLLSTPSPLELYKEYYPGQHILTNDTKLNVFKAVISAGTTLSKISYAQIERNIFVLFPGRTSIDNTPISISPDFIIIPNKTTLTSFKLSLNETNTYKYTNDDPVYDYENNIYGFNSTNTIYLSPGLYLTNNGQAESTLFLTQVKSFTTKTPLTIQNLDYIYTVYDSPFVDSFIYIQDQFYTRIYDFMFLFE
jgi:hypothetical protein